MGKKQTSVSHSSTESEIISLDAGLRVDGSLAFDLWDLIGWVASHLLLMCGMCDRSVTFIEQNLNTNQPSSRKLCARSRKGSHI